MKRLYEDIYEEMYETLGTEPTPEDVAKFYKETLEHREDEADKVANEKFEGPKGG